MAKVEVVDKFQKWINDNPVSNSMLWQRQYSDRVVFIRDRLIPLFLGKDYKVRHTKKYHKQYDIVGEHWSKSILNPAVRIKYKDCEIVFRYNFYDWEIMIHSKDLLILSNIEYYDCYSYTSKESCFYYQGIPEKYHYKPLRPTTTGKDLFKFGIGLNDDLCNVYAFFVYLKQVIDKVA